MFAISKLTARKIVKNRERILLSWRGANGIINENQHAAFIFLEKSKVILYNGKSEEWRLLYYIISIVFSTVA